MNHCSNLITGALSALYSLEATLCTATSRILLIQSYPMAPRTNSSVSLLFSDSQILILIKSYKASHVLLPLQIIIFMIGNLFKEASMPHPLLLFSPHLHILISSNTGPFCYSKHSRHVTSAVSSQHLPITKGFLDPLDKKHSFLSLPHPLPSRNW